MARPNFYNTIRDVADSQSTVTTGMSGLRETTVSGYRSTHATQIFKQGVGKQSLYVIGGNSNAFPPMVQ